MTKKEMVGQIAIKMGCKVLYESGDSLAGPAWGNNPPKNMEEIGENAGNIRERDREKRE